MQLKLKTLMTAATIAAASAVSFGQSSATGAPGTGASTPKMASGTEGSKTPSGRPENQCKNLATEKERQDCMKKAASGGMGSTAASAPTAPASVASRVAP